MEHSFQKRSSCKIPSNKSSLKNLLHSLEPEAEEKKDIDYPKLDDLKSVSITPETTERMTSLVTNLRKTRDSKNHNHARNSLIKRLTNQYNQ